MRVLYFSDNVSDHNRRFIEKLSDAGHKVHFLDPTSEQQPDHWLPDGAHWIQSMQKLRRDAEPEAFAELLPELRNWLREIDPDLIHAGPAHNCGYATALSNFHPWLLMSWGSDILYQAEQGLQWKQAIQLALTSADGFFCDCDTVRSKAKQLANRSTKSLSDDRIVQLPWGIKRGSFAPEGVTPTQAEFARDPATRVVLSTRSWEQLYGINVLLEAFHRAYRIDSSLRLLLMGDGPDVTLVQEFIRARGLTHVVRTPGKIARRDMPKWFRAADVYVSCTLTDGTSISLLEAMATGLPVVVSNLPGNREWVVEGQNGWLARADSAEDFADRLLRAVRLVPEERKLLAERNQEIVQTRADWDRNFPRLLQMYEQLTTVHAK
jgi:L-malate glycosyltransferase